MADVGLGITFRGQSSGPEALIPGKQPGIGRSLDAEIGVGPNRVPVGVGGGTTGVKLRGEFREPNDPNVGKRGKFVV